MAIADVWKKKTTATDRQTNKQTSIQGSKILSDETVKEFSADQKQNILARKQYDVYVSSKILGEGGEIRQ